MSEFDCRADDDRVVFVLGHVEHEALVDLEHCHREPFQVAERDVDGDRNLESGRFPGQVLAEGGVEDVAGQWPDQPRVLCEREKTSVPTLAPAPRGLRQAARSHETIA